MAVPMPVPVSRCAGFPYLAVGGGCPSAKQGNTTVLSLRPCTVTTFSSGRGGVPVRASATQPLGVSRGPRSPRSGVRRSPSRQSRWPRGRRRLARTCHAEPSLPRAHDGGPRQAVDGAALVAVVLVGLVHVTDEQLARHQHVVLSLWTQTKICVASVLLIGSGPPEGPKGRGCGSACLAACLAACRPAGQSSILRVLHEFGIQFLL